MKPDEQRMRDVLVDTIRLLCRTGVEYSHRLRVQGLLGITVDDEHVFLIHVDDFIARNGADADNRLCGFADRCNSPADIGHVTAVTCVSNENCNASTDLHSNATYQHQLASNAKYPNNLSLDQQTHNDILTAVAMSEISSVVRASADDHNLPCLQPSSQSRWNIPLKENNLLALSSENNAESSNRLTSSGNAATAGLATNISETLVPDEVEVENKNRPPAVLTMETDAGDDSLTDNADVPPCRQLESDVTLCTEVVSNQNQHRLSNDDDSSDADTNEDGDSERTSESEEISDHTAVTQLDLLSSLKYDPRALVGNMSRWQVGSLQQHSLSDTGAGTMAVQPAVLTGVVQTGGSHVSAYYQQQVVFFVLMAVDVLKLWVWQQERHLTFGKCQHVKD